MSDTEIIAKTRKIIDALLEWHLPSSNDWEHGYCAGLMAVSAILEGLEGEEE